MHPVSFSASNALKAMTAHLDPLLTTTDDREQVCAVASRLFDSALEAEEVNPGRMLVSRAYYALAHRSLLAHAVPTSGLASDIAAARLGKNIAKAGRHLGLSSAGEAYLNVAKVQQDLRDPDGSATWSEVSDLHLSAGDLGAAWDAAWCAVDFWHRDALWQRALKNNLQAADERWEDLSLGRRAEMAQEAQQTVLAIYQSAGQTAGATSFGPQHALAQLQFVACQTVEAWPQIMPNQSQALYERVLMAYRDILPAQHPETHKATAILSNNNGKERMDLGQWQGAIMCFQTAVNAAHEAGLDDAYIDFFSGRLRLCQAQQAGAAGGAFD